MEGVCFQTISLIGNNIICTVEEIFLILWILFLVYVSKWRHTVPNLHMIISRKKPDNFENEIKRNWERLSYSFQNYNVLRSKLIDQNCRRSGTLKIQKSDIYWLWNTEKRLLPQKSIEDQYRTTISAYERKRSRMNGIGISLHRLCEDSGAGIVNWRKD